jgi:hypothetical protein
MNTYTTARSATANPEALLHDHFGSKTRGPCDAVFADSGERLVAGVSGLPFRAPVMEALFANASFARYAEGIFRGGESLLVVAGERPREGTGNLSAHPEFFASKNGTVRALEPESGIKRLVSEILDSAPEWGGRILDDGSQVIDLKSPLPGPHFAVNLLLGNRAAFPYPLQTTPKSVVDRLGRGSFRSHAATQVLATRWDLRQEENGFPCNRQFYLFENGRQIFYSADPAAPGVVDARCEHAQNRTVIRYSLDCGLEVTRTIFILPQEEGLPIAVEAQRIEIANRLPRTRDIRLVTVGMFGPSKPGALQEDVLYSTIIMESGLLKTDEGDILAVSPSYWPEQDRYDRRFNSLVLHDAHGMTLPREFSFDYTAFVGSGTLECPDGAGFLRNRQSRKGPGFFALAGTLVIAGGERAVADSFTGLVSSRGNPSYDESSLEREVSQLFARYSDVASVPRALDQVRDYINRYSSFLAVDTGDRAFSAYCSRNLPFQSLYQSFVSRSFAQTQKGYREIGFREIQDLFASMYYFNALGQSSLVRELILGWAAQVYEFGYANHNFFWEGKEAGKWSDDALWLHQAVVRYVLLTDDVSILDAEAPIAGGAGKTRALLETLKAALRYSTEISVGPHGIPLLDLADWNDCLKIDRDYASGPEKEKVWKATGKFESNKTESVMNGFLAVRAARDLALLAVRKSDDATASWAGATADNLSRKLRDRAWVGRNYARLLINDHPTFTYAGADGDGLDTDGSGGTLFINSFSWSILAGVASEAEIKSMFGLVLKKLKTPYGLKLVSPMDLSRVVPGVATSEYFPGDRENGAVFKHAAMMAVAACFDAAKSVKDRGLAKDLAREAWTMLDLACPARAMADPFAIAGNPRFCTQYNNSETGENIGPLLSGTATWMILSLMKGFGLEYERDGLRIDPVLRESDREVRLTTRANGLTCEITLTKGEGFARVADGGFSLKLDGVPVTGNLVLLAGKTGTCRIEGTFTN